MMKPARLLAAALLAAVPIASAALATAGPAAAQSWLDRAGDALKTLQGSSSSEGGGDAGLSEARIIDGLKEALSVGADRVVADLGADGGFLDDPEVHIPLPDDLRRAQELLEGVGLGGYGDEVERRLNRGAEAAMPEAGQILASSIRQMTLEDARGILDGPDDAATQYFRRTAGGEIEATLKPIIRAELEQVGALTALDRMLGRYRTLPLVPDVTGDLTAHATSEATDALFLFLAREEAAIRANPTARTTELLKEVFGP
ncbi:MAG: DUF4197 domain-containing protein [Marivibrio sp.]|uniref:DUF4197 domain-containing protein n=1 Tax=Marivibrio sp. TaxID=2039719 RepID=UPI0032EE3228